jgi:Asp-tRNA(Asn)/Glu-tRNA(Gln) amidotransferase A subunit family amidase
MSKAGGWILSLPVPCVILLVSLEDAVAGSRPGEQFLAQPPARPYTAELGALPGRLRIGLLRSDPMAHFPVDAVCATAVEQTGRVLEELGHTVEEAHPPALDRLFERIWPALVVATSVWRATQRQWLSRSQLGTAANVYGTSVASYSAPVVVTLYRSSTD